MCVKRYVAEVLKTQLIEKLKDETWNGEKWFKLEDEKEIEWMLFISREDGDEYCYLEAFIRGLCYRHSGMAWSCAGGEKPEKKIAGQRLVKARPEPEGSVGWKIHICCNCQYCGDKYSFPLPNNLTDVDSVNPLLKHYYCCCGDCELYEQDITDLGITQCDNFEEL